MPPSTTTTLARVVHEGKIYRLYRHPQWTVGQVVTRDLTTVSTARVTETAPGNRPSLAPATKATLQATWLEKALQVDDDGNRTSYRVLLRTWERTQADSRDDSLKDTRLTVTGKGAARKWSFVSVEPTLNDQAREWLDARFGSRGQDDEEWLHVMLPEADVAVGESWTPDPARLAALLAGTGVAIAGGGVTATVTLGAIEDGSARCSFEAKFAVPRIPQTEMQLSKGTLAIAGDMGVAMEPEPLLLRTLRHRATFEGETWSEGVRIQYQFTSDERSTTMPGGSFVEPAP